jgi:hypothetical protein
MSNTETVMGIGGVLVFLFLALIAVGYFAFWLWMLIHSITNKGLKDTEKLLWVLLIVFLAFLGPILYFFIGRPKAAPGPGT